MSDSKQTIERPECMTDDMLEYLDELRASGDTNMFGAAPYLQEDFGLEKREAGAVLQYWMKTFSDRHPQG